ncbi:MAG TPA: DUF4097 family beta strand repeat-containing protein [Acidobacteriaceae bacterium]|nr:DUF4097 family beta strand repeat-containing protein [Acidobacteriaceae bacterium]
MPRLILATSALLLFTPILNAQTFTTGACNGDEGQTNTHSFFGFAQQRVCELRKTVLPPRSELKISNGNGGIEVIGQDRNDIALEARIMASAGSREDAESLAHEVKIDLGDTIHADGPGNSMLTRRSWYVNYHLLVPRHIAAQLHTVNGGIELSGLNGNATAETTNGGIKLDDLAGEVHARTTNGGIEAALSGDRWNGAGLYADTTNGGINVSLPAQYSAHLVAGTTNGGVSVGLPLSGGEITRRHIDANLGSGGATVHFMTTNGGVGINHNSSRHQSE